MSNIDRIRKLLALANNAGANANEADIARDMAARLMAAAGISEEEVRLEEAQLDAFDAAQRAAATVKRERGTAYTSSWQGIAAQTAAHVAGATVYIAQDRIGYRRIRKTFVWIGTTTQRETAQALYAWICAQINRLARSVKGSRSHMRAYRVGVADALATNAKRLVEARTAQTRLDDNARALVRQNAIAAAIERCKPDSLKNLRVTAVDATGLAAGRLDGATITLQHNFDPTSDRAGLLAE